MSKRENIPTYTAEQLARPKALGTSPDVMRTVLADGFYTLAEARKKIQAFLLKTIENGKE